MRFFYATIAALGCGIELAAHYLTEEDAAYDWNRRDGERNG